MKVQAAGRRVARLQNGAVVKQYYYDAAGHMITEADASGNWLRAEIFAGERHLATWANNATYFNHSDWLGTERARTKATDGSRCEKITSLPFGDGMVTQPENGGCGATPDPSPNHFTGKERDTESGLDYFGARYNASSLGRFMSPDPLMASGRPRNPQTWNRYSYGMNNPVRLTDPSGMFTWDTSNRCRENDQKCINKTNSRLEKEHRKVRNWLARADAAIEKMKKSGGDPDKIQRLETARNAIGKEGDPNGVVLGSNNQARAQGYSVGATASMTTLRPDQADGSNYYVAINFSSGLGSANVRATDLDHEGTHIDDYSESLTPLTLREMETRGYETSDWTAQGLGMRSLTKRGVQIYGKRWSDDQMDTAIDQLLDLLGIQ